MAAVAGYPNITMPMGQVHGLPVGISIFGERYSEPTLIEVASGFEHVAGGFVPPRGPITMNRTPKALSERAIRVPGRCARAPMAAGCAP